MQTEARAQVRESAEEGRRLGVETAAIIGDVCSRDDLKRLVDETESKLGPIDLVVAAAGFNTFEPFLLSEVRPGHCSYWNGDD
jgi:short-subunit dehydrogenase